MKTLLIKLMILGKDAQEKNRSWFLEWILHIYILARLLCLISKIVFFQTDYTGQGVDQLQKVIDTIKKNPEDRRIIMCAWNPKGDA